MTAFVEPPRASTTVTASRKARLSAMADIFRFSRTTSTMRDPLAAAIL